MYMLKGGAVPLPRWILVLRAFQLLFAILIIALTAYGLSIYSGGPIRPPLIATIIIAVLTVIPILILTTPLHLAQRKIFDARMAMLLDLFALLFWLAAFTALASYLDIFRYYGRGTGGFNFEFNECRKCRRAYRSAIAATVFAAFEFLLFLLTTLVFVYYYHCHLTGVTAPGLGRRETNKSERAAAGTTAAGMAATGTNGTHATHNGATRGYEGEQNQMSSLPHQTANTNTGNYGSENTGLHESTGPHQSTINGQQSELPYPDGGPRSIGYGAYTDGPSSGFGATPKPNQVQDVPELADR
ncbi:hypothetical protein K505DRAFT_422288 [Melanomma pulvis-pyrius CBS 109.77]|uniref:MARVEL domain-containing protein n=1 Tax=Melanomma pulvis-pyrius CBS 109.77 TaxID=1314802 RepID=A0A6A6WS77_9PLEO|nr:hypothetical protein K505DRAFT_422288 [Melanomma pulvis-pyrius CBS 109.77]